MSWGDDVRDACWRSYAIRHGVQLTDAGEVIEPESEPKPDTVGDRYGYEAPPARTRGRK
jgi:hypothetical protein